MSIVNQWGRYVQPRDVERLLGKAALQELRAKGELEHGSIRLRIVSDRDPRGPAAPKSA